MVENVDAIAFLEEIAGELAQIHRGKHYAQWHGDAAERTNRALTNAEPFSDYASVRIFSGDGASCHVEGRFGDWAIGKLVGKMAPTDIVAAFHEEVARNCSRYEEVSPAIGITVDADIELAPGVRLVPPSSSIFDISGYSYRFQWGTLPEGTAFLVQSYLVTPAFAKEDAGGSEADLVVETQPEREARDAVKERFRRACLLVSPGGLELPISVILADRQSLFQIDGNSSSRPYAARPQVALPTDVGAIKAVFEALETVKDRGVIERAIDRLGRSRLFLDPVDRALDLGMAAEIILMHDAGSSNAEITYKISSRAAWLVGKDADERTNIFELMRDLYTARSKAVHTGKFPTKKPVDLGDADRLVSRTLRAIVERGEFPDWNRIALGGV